MHNNTKTEREMNDTIAAQAQIEIVTTPTPSPLQCRHPTSEEKQPDENEFSFQNLCVSVSYYMEEEEFRTNIRTKPKLSDTPKKDTLVMKNESFSDVDLAKLFGIVTASAATIVHPIITIGAVVWSIGLYKSLDNVYIGLDDSTMRKIFWFDADLSKIDHNNKRAESFRQVDLVKTLSSRSTCSLITAEIVSPHANEVKNLNTSTVTDDTASNSSDDVSGQYRSWEKFENLKNVIHTTEFECDLRTFLNYFVYSETFCKEFQEANGDIDFKVTPFETCQKTGYETRKLTFKTLTKSYFGPTYADAVKTTEVILNKNSVCITYRTKMHNIPYSEKFHIEERWILEEPLLTQKLATTLIISYNVVFAQYKRISPYLEGIIFSKSAATLQERAADFLKLAAKVLEELYSNLNTVQEGVDDVFEEDKTSTCTDILGYIEVDLYGNVFATT